VNWYEAMAFCVWLSHRLGYTVTLPTEVQWEKAPGHRRTDFPMGEQMAEGVANTWEGVSAAPLR